MQYLTSAAYREALHTLTDADLLRWTWQSVTDPGEGAERFGDICIAECRRRQLATPELMRAWWRLRRRHEGWGCGILPPVLAPAHAKSLATTMTLATGAGGMMITGTLVLLAPSGKQQLHCLTRADGPWRYRALFRRSFN